MKKQIMIPEENSSSGVAVMYDRSWYINKLKSFTFREYKTRRLQRLRVQPTQLNDQRAPRGREA